MKTNPLKESGLTENSIGIGTVTRDMVQSRASRPFHFVTMRLGKKPRAAMLLKICAPVAQMDQSGRFLNGKSRFDSGREHHFFQPNSYRIPSLKSDTASDTILTF